MTSRISANSNGQIANAKSILPQITPKGRYVVFSSDASNLVVGELDNNQRRDIFLRDLDNGVTSRLSVSSDGVQTNRTSDHPQITPDGRYVVFSSYASNLIRGGNDVRDIFLRDLDRGKTNLISENESRGEANGNSFRPQITPNGRFVVFQSRASDLVAGDYIENKMNIFLADREPRTGQPPAPPQPSPDLVPPAISPTSIGKHSGKSAYKKACNLKLTSPNVKIKGNKSRRAKISKNKTRRLFTHGSKGEIKWGTIAGKQIKCEKIRMLLLEKRGHNYYIPGTKMKVLKKSLSIKPFSKTVRKLKKKGVGKLRQKSVTSKKKTKFSFKDFNHSTKLGRSALRKLRSKHYRGTFMVFYTAKVNGVHIKKSVKLTSK